MRSTSPKKIAHKQLSVFPRSACSQEPLAEDAALELIETDNGTVCQTETQIKPGRELVSWEDSSPAFCLEQASCHSDVALFGQILKILHLCGLTQGCTITQGCSSDAQT